MEKILIDGHLYAQFLGLNLFRAFAMPDKPGAWMLARLNKDTGRLWEAQPGDVIGLMYDPDTGFWWEGHAPKEGQKKLRRLYSGLNPEYWEHIGISKDDYDLNEMLRHVNL